MSQHNTQQGVAQLVGASNNCAVLVRRPAAAAARVTPAPPLCRCCWTARPQTAPVPHKTPRPRPPPLLHCRRRRRTLRRQSSCRVRAARGQAPARAAGDVIAASHSLSATCLRASCAKHAKVQHTLAVGMSVQPQNLHRVATMGTSAVGSLQGGRGPSYGEGARAVLCVVHRRLRPPHT